GVGSYAVRFATQNGGGGLGMQASYEMDADASGNPNGTGGFGRMIIPSSAFSYLVGPNNNVVKNGSGPPTRLRDNPSNHTTPVTAGWRDAAGTTSPPAAASIAGTLPGTGPLPGAITVLTGGSVSPGAAGGTSVGTLTVGSISFAAGLPTPALTIQVNGGTQA